MSDERVELVDVDGGVLDVVTRSAMRAGNLRHRSVGVVVRHPSDTALLAHRRALWKDVWPGRWDLAFGGVCGVGEDDRQAAVRELAEEAGVVVPPDDLALLGRGAYEDDDVRVVATLFEVCHAGPFRFPDGEVEEVRWIPLTELDRFLAEHAHCPDTASLLRTIRPWGND